MAEFVQQLGRMGSGSPTELLSMHSLLDRIKRGHPNDSDTAVAATIFGLVDGLRQPVSAFQGRLEMASGEPNVFPLIGQTQTAARHIRDSLTAHKDAALSGTQIWVSDPNRAVRTAIAALAEETSEDISALRDILVEPLLSTSKHLGRARTSTDLFVQRLALYSSWAEGDKLSFERINGDPTEPYVPSCHHVTLSTQQRM